LSILLVGVRELEGRKEKMRKNVLVSVLAATAVASVAFGQQDLMRMPVAPTIYNVSVGPGANTAGGGTVVYNNNFPQADPNGLCPAGSTCDSCGDFFVSALWASGSTQKYYSDDIQLGGTERTLVSYTYLVCGIGNGVVTKTVTSELWTAGGLPGDAPAAAIAGSQSSINLDFDANFPCYNVTVTPPPGAILSNNVHLVLTANTANGNGTFAPPAGTANLYVAILDTAEVGASLNQTRRSSGLTAGPWATAAAGAGAPICPPAANEAGCTGGNGGCTAAGVPAACCTGAGTGTCATCNAYRAFEASINADPSNCGNGIVEPGEACDNSDPCCIGCQIATAGTPCRASAGACDVAESCDGTNTACPADMIAGPGVPCRPSSGPCDLAESCDGIGVACPPDLGVTTCLDGDGCCPPGCTNSNDDDCNPVGVPTVSEWGLAILTLIGLVVGTILFSRKRSIA
jgi:hypothetical protein